LLVNLRESPASWLHARKMLNGARNSNSYI